MDGTKCLTLLHIHAQGNNFTVCATGINQVTNMMLAPRASQKHLYVPGQKTAILNVQKLTTYLVGRWKHYACDAGIEISSIPVSPCGTCDTCDTMFVPVS